MSREVLRTTASQNFECDERNKQTKKKTSHKAVKQTEH